MAFTISSLFMGWPFRRLLRNTHFMRNDQPASPIILKATMTRFYKCLSAMALAVLVRAVCALGAVSRGVGK